MMKIITLILPIMMSMIVIPEDLFSQDVIADCQLLQQKQHQLTVLFADPTVESDLLDQLASEYMAQYARCNSPANSPFLLALSKNIDETSLRREALGCILNHPEVTSETILAHYEMASLVSKDRINPGGAIGWLTLGIDLADSLQFYEEKYLGITQLITKHIEAAENALDTGDESRFSAEARRLAQDALNYYPKQTHAYFDILNSYASAHFRSRDIPIIDSIFQILYEQNPRSIRTLVNWGTKLNNLGQTQLALDRLMQAADLVDTSHTAYHIVINKVINAYLILDSLRPAFELSNLLLSHELKMDQRLMNDRDGFPESSEALDLRDRNYQKLWDILIVRAELYIKAYKRTGDLKYLRFLDRVETAFQNHYFRTVKYFSSVEPLIATQQYAYRFFNQAFLDLAIELRDLEKVFKYAEIKKSMTALLLRNHFSWQQSLSAESKTLVAALQDSIREIQQGSNGRQWTAQELLLRFRLDSLFEDHDQIIPDQDIGKIEDIQKVLTGDRALLEYIYTTDSIFALKILNSKALLIPLGSRSSMNQILTRVSEAINDRSYNEIYPALEQAYAALIQPLGKLPRRLIIVPDQQIAMISFAGLLLPGSAPVTKRFMIHDHQIQYNYSSTFWLEMLQQPEKPNSVLALAPSFDAIEASLGLYYNQQEAALLQPEFPGKYLLGNEATVNSFINALKDHSIIHIATHVNVNPVNYLRSSIYLIHENAVQLDSIVLLDIYSHPAFANLVYLSACESGIGRNLSGEGMVSMANGFAAGGAKSILSTLWSTNDQSAFEITKSFYTSTIRGKNKDFALWKAQKDYLKQSTAEGAHPYYWSGIIAIGDMSPLVASKRPDWLFLICGAFIIFMLAWIIRRRHSGLST